MDKDTKALLRVFPRCGYKKCRKKATRKLFMGRYLCDEHAKGYWSYALRWRRVVARLTGQKLIRNLATLKDPDVD